MSIPWTGTGRSFNESLSRTLVERAVCESIKDDRVNKLFKLFSSDFTKNEIREIVNSFDPDQGPNGEWVLRQLKTGQIAREDAEKTHAAITSFKTFRNKKEFEKSNNLQDYTFKTLKDAIRTHTGVVQTTVGRYGIELHKISSGGPYDAHPYHDDWKNLTDWCVAYPEMWESYSEETDHFWYFTHNGAPFVLGTDNGQLMNAEDREVDQEEFDAVKPLLPLRIALEAWAEAGVDLGMDPSPELAGEARAAGYRVWTQYAVHIAKTRIPELEHALLDGPIRSEFIAYLDLVREQDPAIERKIMQEILATQRPNRRTPVEAAFKYARVTRLESWPELGDALEGKELWPYARAFGRDNDVVKAHEEEMLRDADVSDIQWYANDVIKGPWPEAEARMLADPYYALEQAIRYRVRHPAAEAAFLALDPDKIEVDQEGEAFVLRAAVEYAEKVLKRRWPEAEPAILRASWNACIYAEKVIKGPWPEAEAMFARGSITAHTYADTIGHRFQAGEKAIINNGPISIASYAGKWVPGPWPEAEHVLAQDGYWAYRYAVEKLDGRFLAGEAAIAKSGHSKSYIKHVFGGEAPPDYPHDGKANESLSRTLVEAIEWPKHEFDYEEDQDELEDEEGWPVSYSDVDIKDPDRTDKYVNGPLLKAVQQQLITGHVGQDVHTGSWEWTMSDGTFMHCTPYWDQIDWIAAEIFAEGAGPDDHIQYQQAPFVLKGDPRTDARIVITAAEGFVEEFHQRDG